MSMSDIAEGFIKHTEKTFGAAHPTREKVKSARRIVVKVLPSLKPCIISVAYLAGILLCWHVQNAINVHQLCISDSFPSTCLRIVSGALVPTCCISNMVYLFSVLHIVNCCSI